MQNPLANFISIFSLVRDDQGFQVNPLCRHDITRSDRQIGNQFFKAWKKGGKSPVLHAKNTQLVPPNTRAHKNGLTKTVVEN